MDNNTHISNLSQRLIDRSKSQDDIDIGPGAMIVLAAGRKPRFSTFFPYFKKAEAPELIAVCEGLCSTDSLFLSKFEEEHFPICTLDHAINALNTRAAADDEKPSIEIHVDVSCLSRTAIGRLFAEIKNVSAKKAVDLSIYYSLACFSPPPEDWAGQNRAVEPLNYTFSGWTSAPDLPVNVIVGLGYEKGKALGAVEYLEPHERWVLIPNSPETKYLDKVTQHNSELVKGDYVKRLMYEVLRPADTFFSLHSLLSGLSATSRPVLFPFGPKIFFATSLVVAMAMENVSVWHVPGEHDDELSGREPSPHAAIFRCRIETDR